MSKNKKMSLNQKKMEESREKFFNEGSVIDADPNAPGGLSRRHLLEYLSKAGAAAVFLPHVLGSRSAIAAPITGKFKFCLYIHFGSQCGYSNGLIMPDDVGRYPRGVFVSGQQANATNPNLNIHTKHGPLILNPYSASLAGISRDVTNCIVNSRSVSHLSARWYQMTGSSRVSTHAPSWQIGLAGALANYNNMTAIPVGVGNTGIYGRRSIKTTRMVNFDTSNTLSQYRISNTDHPNVPKSPDALMSRLWSFASEMYEKQLGITHSDPVVRAKFGQYVDNAVRGVQEVASGSSIEAAVTAAINSASVDTQIDLLPLGEREKIEIKQRKNNTLIEQLQLAAAMVQSRLGAGMSVNLPGDDFHTPSVSTATRTDSLGQTYNVETGNGSETRTARGGASSWAAIRLFWDYVKSIGMQEDVLVICSHEFTRTAANGRSTKHTVFTTDPSSGVETGHLVDIYGKDHRSVAGYQIITGAFEGQKRFGTVADNFEAAATSDSSGTLNPSAVAMNSRDVIGSILYKFDPTLFPRGERDVRLYYGSDFVLSDLIVNS